MSLASKDYFKAKQRHEQEIKHQLLQSLEAGCTEFPVEQLSSEEVVGSSLYATNKSDFYFSIEAHQTFTDIVRTLRFMPIDQTDLRTWRYVVDEVYRYINYDTFPPPHTQFITEFLNLERIVRGIHIFNLYGSDPEMDIEKASQALKLSPERLSIFIPRTYFKRGSNQHLNYNYGLDKETGLALKARPLRYSIDDFNIGEGEFFTPTFLYVLKTIAKRRSLRTLNAIKSEERLSIKELKSMTWGIDPIIKMADRENGLLHPFPAYDNLLCREITKEEYLDIYGL